MPCALGSAADEAPRLRIAQLAGGGPKVLLEHLELALHLRIPLKVTTQSSTSFLALAPAAQCPRFFSLVDFDRFRHIKVNATQFWHAYAFDR